MDDRSICSFFLEPSQTLQRQYEALRAVFVDGRPMKEIARQFGYRHDTLRALVSRFRQQQQQGTTPPFLFRPNAADQPVTKPLLHQVPKRRTSLTAGK